MMGRLNLFEKFKNLSVSLKATIVFGISSFVISGINYITTPIFTRLLSTSEYGVIAVYNSWISILQVFATLTLIFPGILQDRVHQGGGNQQRVTGFSLAHRAGQRSFGLDEPGHGHGSEKRDVHRREEDPVAFIF